MQLKGTDRSPSTLTKTAGARLVVTVINSSTNYLSADYPVSSQPDYQKNQTIQKCRYIISPPNYLQSDRQFNQAEYFGYEGSETKITTDIYLFYHYAFLTAYSIPYLHVADREVRKAHHGASA